MLQTRAALRLEQCKLSTLFALWVQASTWSNTAGPEQLRDVRPAMTSDRVSTNCRTAERGRLGAASVLYVTRGIARARARNGARMVTRLKPVKCDPAWRVGRDNYTMHVYTADANQARSRTRATKQIASHACLCTVPQQVLHAVGAQL